jgi:hypothetical protein
MRANVVLTLLPYRFGCSLRWGVMYEVVEASGEWIVRKAGTEVARYPVQSAALQAVAERMRQESGGDAAVAFAMRFQNRAS